jgi:hypothetical protein
MSTIEIVTLVLNIWTVLMLFVVTVITIVRELRE